MKKSKLMVYCLLILITIFCLSPMIVLVGISFKSEREFAQNPAGLLFNPTLEEYIGAWELIKKYFLNSIIVVSISTILTCLFCSFTGFIFSSYSFRFSKFMYATIVSGLGVPPQAYLIPLVIFSITTNLYNTRLGLIIIFFLYSLTGSILYFTNYYQSNLPKEVVEAAQLDGCSTLGIYARIALPLSPIIMGLVICFTFAGWYNNLTFPLVLAAGPETQTVSVVLSMMSGRTVVKWCTQMAASVIMTVPVSIIYILGTRYIVRGVLAFQYVKG